MKYEVELKFPLSNSEEIVRRLAAFQAVRKADQIQVDQYFAHPARDFSVTDEALRIRSIGEENRLTYKGPVVDQATKTRHESELQFESGAAAAEQLAQIWEQLGFRRVRVVRKQRQTYHFAYQDRELEVCLDQVDGLGAFLEIETLAGADEKSAAQKAILALAEELELPQPERRSYLEMVLEEDRRASSSVT
jgi:adenylate cyclase class 2